MPDPDGRRVPSPHAHSADPAHPTDPARLAPAARTTDPTDPAHPARLAPAARALLLWALLSLPALTADRVGLNEPRTTGWQLAGLAVLAAAVALARRRPLAAFALTAALGLAAAPALFSVSYGPALAMFALLLGLRAERTHLAVAVFASIGVLGTARSVLAGSDPAPEVLVLTGTLLFGCVFPWLGGRYWRQSRALAEAGWLRAARLEDERRHTEERARLRERARIAQDMHDSLGHELSLLALRAAALQVAPGLADGHRTAAAELRAAAADATDRLHRIIGVLREDDDEPAPLTPAGETIEELVARAADSGLPVRWEPPDTPAPPPGTVADRLLHRVVREALTNAARHAPGAPVTVAVTGEPYGTTVTVTNGRPTAPASSSTGGSGLLGLRTAVTATGGTFRAGPHGEGFRVRAHVPTRQTPTRQTPTRRTPTRRTPTRRTPIRRTPIRRTPIRRTPARQAPARRTPTRPTSAPTPPVTPFPRARRRVALGLGTAAAVGFALVGAAFGWYAYTETRSVLAPSAYARLTPGMPYDEVAPVLPPREAGDPPADRAPAPPPGADCHYYRASGELLTSVDHFRLCFGTPGAPDPHRRLVAKDVVPGVGGPDRTHEEPTP